MQNNIWTEQLHLKNMEKNLLVVMNVGLVVIVANGQVILNIIKIMTLNEEIYKTVMKIPYGKVATYGQIATICGNPYYARAVGNALHKNPNPQKIPCYRVVNSKGKLTENFAFGGLKVQSDLLISEGIEVIDGRVNLEKYQWRG
ncbi:MAG TPA: hypothetical protein DIU40_08200 [Ruminococcaceae bacterium]|nr:hypothetical protein [Oscillospiraceae bacterium]